MQKEVEASPTVLIAALVTDGVVLAAFPWVKSGSDPLIFGIAGVGLLFIFGGE